jgi:hypothetical protein
MRQPFEIRVAFGTGGVSRIEVFKSAQERARGAKFLLVCSSLLQARKDASLIECTQFGIDQGVRMHKERVIVETNKPTRFFRV